VAKTVRKPAPKKKAPAKKEAKEVPPALSHGLTQLYYEIDTVKMQMEMFSDEDLFDYCLPQIEQYKHKELDRLYPKLLQGKKLAPDERKKLEAFCILAHTELFLVV
jgi:hypothetical protein